MAPHQLPITCRQPFRTLYSLYWAIPILIKLPFWSVYYLVPQARPRKSWSWTKMIVFKITHSVGDLLLRVGFFPMRRDLTKEVPPHECKGTRFMWIEPAPSNLVVGQLKRFVDAAGAQGIRIPSYGYGNWDGQSPLPANESEKIVLHFHGGAYIHGTAHPQDQAFYLAQGLLRWAGPTCNLTRILAVDYRLCSAAPYTTTPVNFASPLLDALSSYVHLIQRLRFKPQNIIISGDSAGGHLALALTRYLRDHGPDLGLGTPGGLLLISPWSDPMGTKYDFGSGDCPPNAGTSDFLDFWTKSEHSTGVYARRALLENLGLSIEEAYKNPYLSPASIYITLPALDNLFTGFPPTYIACGDAEALIEEIRLLGRRMSSCMPEGAVVYDEVADALHNFAVIPIWEPESTNTLRKVAVWIAGI